MKFFKMDLEGYLIYLIMFMFCKVLIFVPYLLYYLGYISFAEISRLLSLNMVRIQKTNNFVYV